VLALLVLELLYEVQVALPPVNEFAFRQSASLVPIPEVHDLGESLFVIESHRAVRVSSFVKAAASATVVGVLTRIVATGGQGQVLAVMAVSRRPLVAVGDTSILALLAGIGRGRAFMRRDSDGR
jgi:hypothetical protein